MLVCTSRATVLGNRFLGLRKSFLVLAKSFLVLVKPSPVLVQRVPVRTSRATVLGNRFPVLRKSFLVLGKSFLVLGKSSLVLVKPSLVLEKSYLVLAKPSLVLPRRCRRVAYGRMLEREVTGCTSKATPDVRCRGPYRKTMGREILQRAATARGTRAFESPRALDCGAAQGGRTAATKRGGSRVCGRALHLAEECEDGVETGGGFFFGDRGVEDLADVLVLHELGVELFDEAADDAG